MACRYNKTSKRSWMNVMFLKLSLYFIDYQARYVLTSMEVNGSFENNNFFNVYLFKHYNTDMIKLIV